MIYLTILILLLILGSRFDFKTNFNPRIRNFWVKLVFIILVLLAGLRYKVGGDTFAYMKYFDEDIRPLNKLTVETFRNVVWNPFWIILSSLSKFISNDFFVFQLIHALIVNSVIFWFIKKYSRHTFTSITIYFFFFYLYFNTEVLRESLAVCVFLLGYPALSSKSYLKYSAYCFVALMFHSSAFILFFFPFFSIIKFNKPGVIFILVLLAFIFYFQNEISLFFLSDFEFQKFSLYSEITSNINGVIVNSMIFVIGPYLLLRRYLKYTGPNPIFSNLYVAYFFFAVIIIFIPGFNRFLNYFVPFMSVLFAEVIFAIWKRQKHRNMRLIVLAPLILIICTPKLYFYIQDTSDYSPDTRRYNLWYPYYSVFTKEEYYPRETLYLESVNAANSNH
ncbi:EpsG family protein [Niabella hirudinis]|uniref:EpsG family protein n=1 Tax=Niabella hirudinis TaxID=1285929 RepID=UPI003EC05277